MSTAERAAWEVNLSNGKDTSTPDAATASSSAFRPEVESTARPDIRLAERRLRRRNRRPQRSAAHQSSIQRRRRRLEEEDWPYPGSDAAIRILPPSHSRSAAQHRSTRPKWEPVVQRPAWKIEQDPHLEESALRSLQLQGCQSPLKHYYSEHECEIPRRRLKCAREIRRWQRDRHLILKIAEKLPKELVLNILEYMAVDTMTHIWLHHDLCLDVAAEKLLGKSPATEVLIPLAAQAVLEQSVLAIDTEFQRMEQCRVAVLPAHVFSLPHPVRKMLLTLDFEIPIGRQKYPAIIYTAKAGMASLLSQLQGLRELHLFLNIELTRPPWDHRGSALDVDCRKGFSGTTTFRHAVEELLDAAQSERPGLEIYLEIKYIYEGTWRGAYTSPPQAYNVAKRAMTSEAVLREADAKWSECHFSQG